MSSRGLQRCESSAIARPWPRTRGVSSAVIVGNLLFFDITQMVAALDKIDGQFNALRADLLRAFGGPAGLVTGATTHPAQFAWFDLVFQPASHAWDALYGGDKVKAAKMYADSAFGAARGDWDAVEKWDKTIRELRAGAKAHGFTLTSPEPPPLPTTTFDDVADGAGSVAKYAKYALYAGAAVAGAFAIKMLADAFGETGRAVK